MTNYVAQVGGDHYKSAYAHWDLAIDIRWGYLDGSAAKYISRWRKKGGVQDLRKALSYIDKLIGTLATEKQQLPPAVANTLQLERFCDAHGFVKGSLERTAIIYLGSWAFRSDLEVARVAVVELIAENEVPTTDSNKHAKQEEQC